MPQIYALIFLASHNPKVDHSIHKKIYLIERPTPPSKIMATRYYQLHALMPYFAPAHTVLGVLGKCGTGLPRLVFDAIPRFPISFQIIDPHDAGIAGSISQNLIPDERLWNPETLLGSSGCVDRTQELTHAYFEYISGLQTKYTQVPR